RNDIINLQSLNWRKQALHSLTLGSEWLYSACVEANYDFSRQPSSKVYSGAGNEFKRRRETMMRLRWAAVLGVVFAVVAAVAENPCTPSTLVAKQKRTEMKHREPASSGTHVEPTTVAEMISWEQPDELADREVRSSNSPIDPREEEVYALDGDLWRIAEEA